MKDYYEQIECKTWNEFKVHAENSRLEWIFRGQSNSKWDLQTSLERSNIIESYDDFEEEIIRDFKKGLKFYLKDEIMPTTMLEHVSMLQHFGAPSRLLDFTKSPYVAAYFAFEQACEEFDEIAIWIVNKIYLYQRAVYYFEENKIDFSSKNNKYVFDDETFTNVLHKSKKGGFNCIFPVEPKNHNQRYHLQQSIFLAQGNQYEPLLSQLEFINDDIMKQTFMKITIPYAEKELALRDLMKMNINHATLFPGLDGFAKSLLMKYGNLPTFGDSYKYLNFAKSKNMA